MNGRLPGAARFELDVEFFIISSSRVDMMLKFHQIRGLAMLAPPGPSTVLASVAASLVCVFFLTPTTQGTVPAPPAVVCSPCAPAIGYSPNELYIFGALCLFASIGVTWVGFWAIGGIAGWTTSILAGTGLAVAGQAAQSLVSTSSSQDKFVVRDGSGGARRFGWSPGSAGSSASEETWRDLLPPLCRGASGS